MLTAFAIWSITALLFAGIGVSIRRSDKPTGFFTFVKPPAVSDTRRYNHAVAVLWIVSAVFLEMLGVPFLFIEQNSPAGILIILAVAVLVIAMMIIFGRIEAKYRI